MSSFTILTNQGSYVVVPRRDYEDLYNKQYTQLTSLQKKVDPDLKRQSYFETVLKTHYPKVYQDMIRNDYILTRPVAIDAIEGTSETDEVTRANMQRQLSDVATNRQPRVKLSNPLYTFTRRYLSNLVNDSSISPHKRQLLYHHLHNYAKKIPVHINRPLTKTEAATQAQVRINARPGESRIPVRQQVVKQEEDLSHRRAKEVTERAIRGTIDELSTTPIVRSQPPPPPPVVPPRRSTRLRQKKT